MSAVPTRIRVYLDTNDYWESSKALASQKSGPTLDLYAYLMERRKHGAIDIRFSHVHVMELVDNAPEHKNNAIERRKFMRELSGDMPMLPLDALIRNELLAAKGGAALPPMSGLAARGNWFPDFKPLM